jgi:hypothetical protein
VAESTSGENTERRLLLHSLQARKMRSSDLEAEAVAEWAGWMRKAGVGAMMALHKAARCMELLDQASSSRYDAAGWEIVLVYAYCVFIVTGSPNAQ